MTINSSFLNKVYNEFSHNTNELYVHPADNELLVVDKKPKSGIVSHIVLAPTTLLEAANRINAYVETEDFVSITVEQRENLLRNAIAINTKINAWNERITRSYFLRFINCFYRLTVPTIAGFQTVFTPVQVRQRIKNDITIDGQRSIAKKNVAGKQWVVDTFSVLGNDSTVKGFVSINAEQVHIAISSPLEATGADTAASVIQACKEKFPPNDSERIPLENYWSGVDKQIQGIMHLPTSVPVTLLQQHIFYKPTHDSDFYTPADNGELNPCIVTNNLGKGFSVVIDPTDRSCIRLNGYPSKKNYIGKNDISRVRTTEERNQLPSRLKSGQIVVSLSDGVGKILANNDQWELVETLKSIIFNSQMDVKEADEKSVSGSLSNRTITPDYVCERIHGAVLAKINKEVSQNDPKALKLELSRLKAELEIEYKEFLRQKEEESQKHQSDYIGQKYKLLFQCKDALKELKARQPSDKEGIKRLEGDIADTMEQIEHLLIVEYMETHPKEERAWQIHKQLLTLKSAIEIQPENCFVIAGMV